MEQLSAYPDLAVTGQLAAIGAQIDAHTDGIDLAADRAALGTILCQELTPTLALLASYNPGINTWPTVLARLPGRTVTPTLTVMNRGHAPATAVFNLSGVPANWSVTAPEPVTLQPSISQQLSLPVTPNVLGTGTVSVTMQFTEAPGLAVTQTVAPRVVSDLLHITGVTLEPAFLNVGTGNTDLSIRLTNPAGLRAAATADIQLTDATGAIRKQFTTPFIVAVNNSGPFYLGQLAIDGLETGIYTATVRLLWATSTWTTACNVLWRSFWIYCYTPIPAIRVVIRESEFIIEGVVPM